jgi:magnesium chelatase family protein
MALARTCSVALSGISGILVEVEADLGNGLPGFTIVGLPDASVNESRDRVRAAVVNSQEDWPQRRITVGLSPASVHKRGSGFDLAVACAVLAAAGVLPPGPLAGLVLLGELGLDGAVRPVRGVLPSVLAATTEGLHRVVVPEGNLAEAELVPDVSAVGVRSLRQLLAALRGEPEPPGDDPGTSVVAARRIGQPQEPVTGPAARVTARAPGPAPQTPAAPDLADVSGQFAGRRALEICAAGGHHLFLHGPPGAGKTMLAERLPGLLPPLDREAALEVTAIHSVAGLLPPDQPLITTSPFRAPHHTASLASLVGGGSQVLRPGAVSLAHRGVLFLDEAPEFAGGVLDALRQPLESGTMVVARLSATVSFPARFLLVLGANPCPCGMSSGKGTECRCTPMARRRYLGKLSGPLLDRIDVRLELLPVGRAELLADTACVEPSAVVAERVREARERASARLAGTPWRTNAEVPGRELRSRWRPEPAALRAASAAMDRGRLTARGFDRVLRVAWTIADLHGHAHPTRDDVSSALYYRSGTVGAMSA